MAIVYNGLFGSAQSKTSDLILVINPADITVAVGDDIFVAVAQDDVGGDGPLTITGSGTATWTTTKEKVQVNTGNVKAVLYRLNCTGAGTLTQLTLDWVGTNIPAKAAVAGWFSGVGTLDLTDGSNSATNTCKGLPSDTAAVGDLGLSANGWEGPNGDDSGLYSNGVFHGSGGGSPTEVGQNGTTGGGAASNITCTLIYSIAGSSGTGELGATNLTSARDNAGAGAVYSPAGPPTSYGAVAFPITVDRVTQGRLGAKGAVVFPITASRVVAGRLTAFSAVALPITLDRVVAGSRTRLGAVVAPFILDRYAAGRVTAKGAVVFPITLGVVTAGTRILRGKLDLPIAFGVFSDGNVVTGPTTWYGAVVMPLSWQVVTSGYISIYVRPGADSVDGTWTDQAGGSNLSGAVDEDVPSDADYVTSELDPTASACRMKFQAVSDPTASYGHAIIWRVGKSDAGGDQMDVTIKLRQGGGDALGGGTLIASFQRTNVAAFVTYREALSGAEADAITNYGDLYVELEATAS